MYQVTRAAYRYAMTEDEIPRGRVVTVIDEPGLATVVVRPGEATPGLLESMTAQQTSLLVTGQWLRLEPDHPEDAQPQRLLSVSWRLMPAEMLPNGVLCMPVERPGLHVWIIREGEASERLVREMTELLTEMVQDGIWVQQTYDLGA
ncbi:hypothetical protein [Streptomyces thermolilacinus]|uniref:hypothetical protein n=1 Tax=Streptomyces thermolilacinus TaxID=285540 RepID=UPI0033EE9845